MVFKKRLQEQQDQLLMGMKKRGFGTGIWQHSFTGKIEHGESPIQTAARELREEAGLIVDEEDLALLGVFVYKFVDPAIIDYVMEVNIFTTSRISGEPRGCPEIDPHFFDVDKIPLLEMWPDNRYWLPELLRAALTEWPPSCVPLKAEFIYKNLHEIQSFDLQWNCKE